MTSKTLVPGKVIVVVTVWPRECGLCAVVLVIRATLGKSVARSSAPPKIVTTVASQVALKATAHVPVMMGMRVILANLKVVPMIRTVTIKETLPMYDLSVSVNATKASKAKIAERRFAQRRQIAQAMELPQGPSCLREARSSMNQKSRLALSAHVIVMRAGQAQYVNMRYVQYQLIAVAMVNLSKETSRALADGKNSVSAFVRLNGQDPSVSMKFALIMSIAQHMAKPKATSWVLVVGTSHATAIAQLVRVQGPVSKAVGQATNVN